MANRNYRNTDDAAEELRELKKLRDLIDKRIERLQLRVVAPKVINGQGHSVVLVTELKPYIQEWIDSGKQLIALADRADVSEETLLKIMGERQETVYEKTADKILVALGLPHVFNELVPSPPISKYWEE